MIHILQALILGITQGLTEFIPVSSSGHLILVGHLIGFKDSGLAFDTALDIGTLGALLIFFRRDIVDLLRGLISRTEHSRLSWLMVLATVPGVLAGVALQHLAETTFRSAELVAINLIIVAFVMLAADRLSKGRLDTSDITAGRAVSIGLAQALALVPGVSRSGITISAGMLAGLDRVSATRFSFLLSAPIIAGATAKVVLKPENLAQWETDWALYLTGIIGAFVSGYLAIKFMLSYLGKHGLSAFAYYRIVVGAVILAIGLK
ncbi:MAG TPA: undecaprenyl-diphosphate phosphatase [Candidatus Saccharimonadales bacterium]|nr:undecaprenyl-diphosphate phosphatase [Candidatus Saccharimonadales bacterium]